MTAPRANPGISQVKIRSGATIEAPQEHYRIQALGLPEIDVTWPKKSETRRCEGSSKTLWLTSLTSRIT
ncbi:hypothetical protein ASPCAL14829 [Aspergillus calidoustus]|uniref:Uncharacterized protein n=1 Tax=Aspergillus calidoustus TaxID=454130 RepID=A0A0U5HBY4_ASPCI|nr:hypothetical protein ASPCAL14829 [Aspergillus calidoustus]